MTVILDRARLTRSLVAAIFAGLLLLAGPVPDAFADSLREVAERVARQHDGKVIAAREVQRNGRRYYEIRILTRDGVVRTIRVPADDRGWNAADLPASSRLNPPVEHAGSRFGPTARSFSAPTRPLPNHESDAGSRDTLRRSRLQPRPNRN